MFNLDDITNKNNEEYNPKWSYILGYNVNNWRFQIEENNVLFHLIREKDSDELVDKIYLYTKDFNESKYQSLIKKHEDVGIKHLSDPKAFIEYSNAMDNVYNNIDD